MRKVILHLVRATFPVIAGCSAFIYTACAQQYVIADKDRTRTDINISTATLAQITSFSAIKLNGFNEIKWSAVSEQDTRRFIVEYSTDGISFQTASEMTPVDGVYELKHHIFDTRPLLYRIRIEKIDGRFFNSANLLLDGIAVSPIQLYPTAIKGNMVNINASFPVESAKITSLDGSQVFQKNIGGVSGYIPIAIPTVGKGMYFMTFYGNGWQATEKILIAE